MNGRSLASIVINNYNYGQFLRAATDSALAQTYPNVEVIVVDDGSTDDSREIIATYVDRIIPVLKDNGGQASALNAGFTQSRGEVVIFLDADDMLLPEIVEQVMEIFCAHPQTAKVQYRMEVIDVTGRRTGIVKPSPHLAMRSGDLSRHVLRFTDDMTWMATSGNAFQARVLARIFPVPEREYGRLGADWYLAFVPLLFGPIVSADTVGAYFRVHSTNRYEFSALDVNRVRQGLKYMCTTHVYIKKFADVLGLTGFPSDPTDVLSIAFLGYRLVSLRLDPASHPIKTDAVWPLVGRGIVASSRRYDVSFPMKVLYVLWFVAMALAPGSHAAWLAEKFLFPESRGQVNTLLGRFHRGLETR